MQNSVKELARVLKELGVPVSSADSKKAVADVLAEWDARTALVTKQDPTGAAQAKDKLVQKLNTLVDVNNQASVASVQQRLSNQLLVLKAALPSCQDASLWSSEQFTTCVSGIMREWGAAAKEVR